MKYQTGIGKEALFLVCYGFVYHRHAWKWIEKVYAENELEYYQAYKRTGLDIPTMMAKNPLDMVQVMYKVAGILQWAEEQDNKQIPSKLIQKNFKRVWEHVKRHKGFHILTFKDFFFEKENIFMRHSFSNQAMIAQYLCTILGYSFTLDGENNSFSGIHRDIMAHTLETYFQEKEIQVAKYNEKFLQEEEVLGSYSKSVQRASSIRKFFNDIMNERITERLQEVEEEALKQVNQVVKLNSIGNLQQQMAWFNQKREQAISEVYKDHQVKWIASLETMMHVLGFSAEHFTTHVSMSKDELAWFTAELQLVKESFELSEEQVKELFFTCLELFSIEKEYRKVRDLALNGEKERIMMEKQQLEHERNEFQQQQERERHEWEAEKKKMQEEIDRLKQETISKDKQLDAQEKRFYETKKNNKEVYGLRKHLAFVEGLQQIDTSVLYEEKKREINKKQIVIIGGHQKWQVKMQMEFPDCIIIHVDDINRELRMINRADAVFLNTSVLNHGFYYKLMSVLEENETSLYYLTGASNIERNVDEMYQVLKEQRKRQTA